MDANSLPECLSALKELKLQGKIKVRTKTVGLQDDYVRIVGWKYSADTESDWIDIVSKEHIVIEREQLEVPNTI